MLHFIVCVFYNLFYMMYIENIIIMHTHRRDCEMLMHEFIKYIFLVEKLFDQIWVSFLYERDSWIIIGALYYTFYDYLNNKKIIELIIKLYSDTNKKWFELFFICCLRNIWRSQHMLSYPLLYSWMSIIDVFFAKSEIFGIMDYYRLLSANNKLLKVVVKENDTWLQ